MHKITFEWMEGSQIRSRTISSDEQTIVAKKIRIGRDSSLCDVVVEDPKNQVSRLHAEIYFNPNLDSFCVCNATWDQTNPNVLFVDEILVTDEEKILHSGSIIKLREIPLKIVEIQLDQSTVIINPSPQPAYQNSPNPANVISNPSPQPAYQNSPNPSNVINKPSPQPGYQNSPNPSNVINNPSPQPVGKGNIKLGASILQRASRDDFDAIATIFEQFIPQNEKIHIARYLGILGIFGIGTRNFACVTDTRVAYITTDNFGEVTYQDGYLEHINSGAIYQPSIFYLYLLIGFYLFSSYASVFKFLNDASLLPTDFFASGFSSSMSGFVLWFLILAFPALILNFFIKGYYRLVKSGLVLTVREGQLYLNPIGGFAFGQRLIRIFANPKFVARANSIYRYFIIQKETRLNQVEKYPLSKQQKNSSRLTAISISSSLQNYPDNNTQTGVLVGLGIGVLGLVGIISLAAWSKDLLEPFPEPTNTPSLPDIITPSPTPIEPNLVQEINQKLYNAIRQELGDNPICEQDLVYQVVTNQDGIILAYKSLNKVSSERFRMTPLPKLIASANTAMDQQPYALFQVVFKANAELEVTNLQVLKAPQ
jgi:hypothetical protein